MKGFFDKYELMEILKEQKYSYCIKILAAFVYFYTKLSSLPKIVEFTPYELSNS